MDWRGGMWGGLMYTDLRYSQGAGGRSPEWEGLAGSDGGCGGWGVCDCLCSAARAWQLLVGRGVLSGFSPVPRSPETPEQHHGRHQSW